MKRSLIRVLAAVAAVAACFGGSLDPLPLDVTLSATPTAVTTSDSVSIVVNAQGGSLVGVITEFGDGATDQFSTGGARTAKVTFRHRYLSTGKFQVTATVTDAVLGTKSASVQVQVN
jgi:hypothetical protein